MRAYEIPKNGAEIRRGLVMMAIEGAHEVIQVVRAGLESSGFPSTDCGDYGDKDGDIIEYFMVSRSDLPEFKMHFRSLKHEVTVFGI
jgi:hypothetical protein